MIKTKTIVHKLLFISAVGMSILALFFVVICTWIGYEVKNQCFRAQQKHSGDCVESLSQVVKDEQQDFRSRNDAIWALGQFGDQRALPVLESYYTGIIPDREPLNQMISQYELKKAINLSKGGTNISAIIWRGLFN